MRNLIGLLMIASACSCHKPLFSERWLTKKAPEKFTAAVETSRGVFEIQITRNWSPLAADRLYQQIKHGYYDNSLFYRVRPGFVAQFGGDDTLRMQQWAKYKLPDEPVLQPNEEGTISFARSGKETRGNDLFVNLRNNSPRLDTISPAGVKGYPVLGRVTSNKHVVDSLYSGYGDTVFGKYDLLLKDKNAFLEMYPKLDAVKRIYILKKKS